MAVRIQIGERNGSLVVVERLENRRFRCLCNCGRITIVHGSNIRRGNTTSCGCVRNEMYQSGKANLRHGHARNRRESPTYRTWAMMLNRCGNEKASQYPYYGGRGITVCARWAGSFENFLADMGERPSGKTIDRINPNGHYEPDNCRWATPKEQAANRRPRRSASSHRTLHGAGHESEWLDAYARHCQDEVA